VLAYFRSQHDNQSWIASLTAILVPAPWSSSASKVLANAKPNSPLRSLATLSSISRKFLALSSRSSQTVLPAADLLRIRDTSRSTASNLTTVKPPIARLTELRGMYEPYIFALASYLLQPCRVDSPSKGKKDNWQTTAWGQASGVVETKHAIAGDDHFYFCSILRK